MKKSLLILSAAAGISLAYAATDRLWFANGNISMGLDVEALDSISVKGSNLAIATKDGNEYLFDRSAVNSFTASQEDETTEVLINFDGDVATVVNPYAFNGVSVSVDGADVTVNADTQADSREVVYHLSGQTTTGSFKIYSTYKLEILLDNVSITNDNGAAINIQTGKKTTIRTKDGSESSLCDSKTYNTPEDEDEKATLFSEGQIEFRGKGTLNVTGNKKHAICSDDYVDLKNTKIVVVSAASDGIHVNDYVNIQSGSIKMSNLGGDGIDAGDEGYINMLDGTLDIAVSGDSNKGLKASGGAISIEKGDITLTMTGNSTVENYDPSYCSGIKAGGDFVMNGGSLNITSSGKAGKGISVDGNANFNGGTITVEVSGAGGSYTTSSSVVDSYSATCITVDGNANLTAGTFTLSTKSTATGGKCLKVDGVLTIGDTDNCPIITASTAGNQFRVSTSSGSGGGGNRPGGGWGGGWGGDDNSDYCNPKVIRAEGNLIINNGDLDLLSTATTEGGECLESKAKITINGGKIAAKTYDDCINAATDITINGGEIYCYSTNNDGIDSNGTIHINGGHTIAFGTTTPECGLDCDNNSNFTLTGGIVIANGGSNNTPSASGTTQRYVSLSSKLTSNTEYTFTDADGNFLFSFCPPVTSAGSNTFITCPEMTAKSKSIKMYQGATISGGDSFHGLTTGASYSGGSLKQTLTTK